MIEGRQYKQTGAVIIIERSLTNDNYTVEGCIYRGTHDCL